MNVVILVLLTKLINGFTGTLEKSLNISIVNNFQLRIFVEGTLSLIYFWHFLTLICLYITGGYAPRGLFGALKEEERVELDNAFFLFQIKKEKFCWQVIFFLWAISRLCYPPLGVINLSKIYEKLPCKIESYWFGGYLDPLVHTERHTDIHPFTFPKKLISNEILLTLKQYLCICTNMQGFRRIRQWPIN